MIMVRELHNHKQLLTDILYVIVLRPQILVSSSIYLLNQLEVEIPIVAKKEVSCNEFSPVNVIFQDQRSSHSFSNSDWGSLKKRKSCYEGVGVTHHNTKGELA